MRCVLSLAGFDPSGGAGVLADLKVFEALGLWGLSCPTAMTVQNSVSVQSVAPAHKELFTNQYQALQKDFSIAGVKLGMLATEELTLLVSHWMAAFEGPKVLDPVLVSSSGQALLEKSALNSFKGDLMPQVDLITPNLAEASVLSGVEVTGQREMGRAAEVLIKAGARAVLIKGGHLSGAPCDLYLGPEGEEWIEGTRIEGKDPHGTGCLLSSAILGFRLRGLAWPDAVRQAKTFAAQAIAEARLVGKGKEFWTPPKGY